MKVALRKFVQSVIEKAVAEGAVCAEAPRLLALEASKVAAHGDFSTTVALLLAQYEKRPPRAVAAQWVALIQAAPDYAQILEKVEIAGPGYINFFLKAECGYRALLDMVREGADYGRSQGVDGPRVQIEFVSANPTGPLHVAHGRAAALGDALANLLAAVGYDVHREYYINDIGNQTHMLGLSTYLRYRELFGEAITLPEEGYRGEYIIEIARAIQQAEGRRFLAGDAAAALPFFTAFALKTTLEWIRRDMDGFGVRFDRWFSEQELGAETDAVLALLQTRGALYEKEGATWLVTTQCGDDKDRVAVRADGRRTYFASDIAYHRNKFERGFDRLINIWGADHHGYIARVKAAVALMGYAPDRLVILLHQLVNLMRHGAPVPMSKRAGEFVTLQEVIEEVGVDATRFFFLMRRADTTLDFDLELAKKHSNENPVYYVQYAHARLCSILRVAASQGVDVADTLKQTTPADLARLTLPEEWAILRHLTAYPDLLCAAAEALEPHRVVFYLQELAGMLHRYYFAHRIISDDPILTRARLTLIVSVQTVLRNALTLLGIRAPDQM